MSKIAFLVMYEVPYPSMVGAEEPKKFEFNTSALLEKSLKAPPSHSSRLLFFFFLFILFGCQGLGADTMSAVSRACWIRQCQPQSFATFQFMK